MTNNAFIDTTYYYDQYKLTVYNSLFVGVVYGVYTEGRWTLTVCGFRGKRGFTSSRSKMVMFAITTFTFVLGIIALVLQTALGFQKMWWLLDRTAANVWPLGRIGSVSIVVETIRRLMYILSDIICAWRAVVLWNRDKYVIAILLFFILGTTAAVGCEFGLTLIPILSPPYRSIPIIADDFGPLLVVFPILGTNLVSTALIAMKAWQYRVSVGKHLGKGTGSLRVNRVFALLIESGFVYCCLWILYVILTFNLNTTLMHNALLFVSGLYPTLIIILVAMQKSPVENYSTYSTGMQFASAPALARPRPGNTLPFVYTIYREHMDDSNELVPSTVFMKTPSDEQNP